MEPGPPTEHRGAPSDVPPDFFPSSPEARTVRLSLASSDSWIIDTVAGVGVPEQVGDRTEVEITVGGDACLVRLLMRLGSSVRLVDDEDAGEIRALVSDAAGRILQRYEGR